MTEEEKRLRHNPNSPAKQSGDHAGHLIGDRFGGSPKLDNIISQLARVNLSTFKIIENDWAEEIDPLNGAKPEKVLVEIKVNYSGNNLRPTSFEVKYKIGNGEIIESPVILNY